MDRSHSPSSLLSIPTTAPIPLPAEIRHPRSPLTDIFLIPHAWCPSSSPSINTPTVSAAARHLIGHLHMLTQFSTPCLTSITPYHPLETHARNLSSLTHLLPRPFTPRLEPPAPQIPSSSSVSLFPWFIPQLLLTHSCRSPTPTSHSPPLAISFFSSVAPLLSSSLQGSAAERIRPVKRQGSPLAVSPTAFFSRGP